jgi:hypothetical protein
LTRLRPSRVVTYRPVSPRILDEILDGGPLTESSAGPGPSPLEPMASGEARSPLVSVQSRALMYPSPTPNGPRPGGARSFPMPLVPLLVLTPASCSRVGARTIWAAQAVRSRDAYRWIVRYIDGLSCRLVRARLIRPSRGRLRSSELDDRGGHVQSLIGPIWMMASARLRKPVRREPYPLRASASVAE